MSDCATVLRGLNTQKANINLHSFESILKVDLFGDQAQKLSFRAIGFVPAVFPFAYSFSAIAQFAVKVLLT
ncbi:MAG: hypothetical protein WBA86_13645 [Nodosilinea sp.]